MKVIMQRDVGGVGQRGAVVDVSDGYALNHLIPNGLAVQATPDKLATLKSQESEIASKRAAQEREHADLSRRIEGITLEVAARANAQGHLYNQLSAALVQKELEKRVGVSMPPQTVVFDKSIREVGEWQARANLGVYAPQFKVVVRSAT